MGLDTEKNSSGGGSVQTPEKEAQKGSQKSDRDEFGLTEEDYRRWAASEGHRSEDLLMDVLCNYFEMKRLEPGEVPPPQGVPKGTYYIGHLPGTSDWKGEGDFVIYIALKDNAHSEDGFLKINFDLTTADPLKEKNAAHIKKKLDREDSGGPLYLNIPNWAIVQAQRGGVKGLSLIAKRMSEMLNRAADRAKKLRNK
ncbi:MAG: hypothetical protein KatS3mg101_0487 [Patescibacteria group bacterium]|nr:MAG: hypothetical protein KatS3mg101_0487 [Patescibacteria group bacterium]